MQEKKASNLITDVIPVTWALAPLSHRQPSKNTSGTNELSFPRVRRDGYSAYHIRLQTAGCFFSVSNAS